MMSIFELHGLDERAALELAKRRRDEALSKFHDARREFEGWDRALNRLRAAENKKIFAGLDSALLSKQEAECK